MPSSRIVVLSLWVLSVVLVAQFGASAQFGPGQEPPGVEVRFVPSREGPVMPGGMLTGTFVAFLGGQWVPVEVLPESKGGLRPVDVRP